VSVRVAAANNITQEFRQLRDRTVDFLVGGLPRSFAESDLDLEVLYEDRPFIVAGQNSQWARRRKIELVELADEQWVLPLDSIFASFLAEMFQANGISFPKLGVRSHSIHQRMMLLTTNRFVSAESGSALRFSAARIPVKILPVNLAVRTWPVGIVTLKNRALSCVVQNFIDTVRELGKLMVTIQAPRRY
jgi:DNA-binding transcriptional LysR family regulator